MIIITTDISDTRAERLDTALRHDGNGSLRRVLFFLAGEADRLEQAAPGSAEARLADDLFADSVAAATQGVLR